MKITFLVYNIFGIGGTVRTVANTANYFASMDYDVEIISVRRTRKKPTFKFHKKVKITHLFDARRGMLFGKNTPLYKKLIKRILLKIPSRYIDKTEDLYHMFNFFVDLKIISALKKINKGVLITTIPSFNILATKFVSKNVIKIGQEHKYFEGHDSSLQRKIKKYYDKLDALACLTDYDIERFRKNLKGEVDIYKIENATHLPPDNAALDSKVIMAAGRFVYQKGFDLLIPAFSRVIEKHPEWKLKIFGAGQDEPLLREKIFEEEAYNNIFLMPKTNDVIGEMIKSSVYVLSSRYEPFGMVIIEAMSVGLPCVSFACSGPKEIIRNNEDGILVEEGNIEQLSEALLKMIENENLRKEMGRNAKKNVERYTFNVIGEKWQALLKEQEQKKAKE
ncbi:Glycosyltransferase involved in cell wall bisynthesis [Salinibacillus kushneri]|uniref:Glycosyltransferase involved in cell wall bisynthesis n=1 Tax=Salinibacillus kushneri TaxID=237682 RepID=A0A1I0JIG3_9BACI|nr:glycosyltransferase family 4 protein [Salinibacillus kushneri]SEU09321.1 Glycosyltransferase involved in cell wall bisynthesis [Salinibacillus kushneri]